MSNPFEDLRKQPKEQQGETFDTWEGQFSCQHRGCLGWANLARHYPDKQLLLWDCQWGHESRMENAT